MFGDDAWAPRGAKCSARTNGRCQEIAHVGRVRWGARPPLVDARFTARDKRR
jgi:hypothetical protein